MFGKDKHAGETSEVDKFMEDLKHPLKDAVEEVRNIIKSVNENITEQIKWAAPSFSYKDQYMVTFNLRREDIIHLVFHNEHITKVDNDLLEGDYADRRMMYIEANEVAKIKPELVRIISELIEFIDSK